MLSLAPSVRAIIVVCIGDESDLYVPTSDRSCLFSLGSGGVSYGLKALVNLCLGMLKLMKGK